MSDKKASRAPAGSKRSASPSPSEDSRVNRLERLVRIFESSSLADLEYEDAEIKVSLGRHSAAPAMAQMTMPAMHMPAMPAMPPIPPPPNAPPPIVNANPPLHASNAPAAADDKSILIVRSPFVGTFYKSPSPEAQPFCEVGKKVRRGQTICIIEAMKLMNEIESEVDGLVLEILPENGKAVQYGDALFKIQTS